ncbi:MAG: hypothetical protein MGG37_03890 [Trichodesmium sp. MAG_R01]|nr:hypothetical protein [Trichodesmium sp. MAG_R01]
MTTTRERQEQLARWLNLLVETLRLQGGPTWEALLKIVSEKTVAIALDDIPLQVSAEGGDTLQLRFEYAVPSQSINFRSDADTLRDIVSGRLTLDGALANTRIYACHNFEELLGIHEVVTRILADSASNSRLQELWMEFDSSWPVSKTSNRPSPLKKQKPAYGYFIENLPEDVLAIEVIKN